MKIVIDIPDDVYNSIKSTEEIINYIAKDGGGSMALHGSLAIINGIILPKGHGRLIDADALDKDCESSEYHEAITSWLDLAPTIIKADKE